VNGESITITDWPQTISNPIHKSQSTVSELEEEEEELALGQPGV